MMKKKLIGHFLRVLSGAMWPIRTMHLTFGANEAHLGFSFLLRGLVLDPLHANPCPMLSDQDIRRRGFPRSIKVDISQINDLHMHENKTFRSHFLASRTAALPSSTREGAFPNFQTCPVASRPARLFGVTLAESASFLTLFGHAPRESPPVCLSALADPDPLPCFM